MNSSTMYFSKLGTTLKGTIPQYAHVVQVIAGFKHKNYHQAVHSGIKTRPEQANTP